MNTRSKCCLILVALCVTATARAEELRAEMEAANSEWLAAYSAANGAAFEALYTRDALLLPPGRQPLVGAEAIGHFWADVLKDRGRENHTFEIVSIQRDGRYAYQVARWTLEVVNDKGETAKKAGNAVRIFEKQPNGKWLTKVHIFNAY